MVSPVQPSVVAADLVWARRYTFRIDLLRGHSLMPRRQLDLFSGASFQPDARPAVGIEQPCLTPSSLDDASLVAAIPKTSLRDCHALAAEAGQRHLIAAVPALEALCRRFKGFGTEHRIPEQIAALEGLAAIGHREAANAVARIITDQVMQGPGLAHAVAVAARLSARIPRPLVVSLLRHRSPDIRANACRFSQPSPEVIALLRDLLSDLNVTVAAAAACALGRMGQNESRPALVRLLCERPSVEVIEAIATVADEECLVLLGRVARSRPGLTETVIAALNDMDSPRAATIVAAIRRWHDQSRKDPVAYRTVLLDETN